MRKSCLFGRIHTEALESTMSIEVLSEMALRHCVLSSVVMRVVGVSVGVVVGVVRLRAWRAMALLGS